MWSVYCNGIWISDLISNVTASSSALESIETTFHQDLNGDGLIGVDRKSAVKGKRVNLGGRRIIKKKNTVGGSSGPELKFGGAAYSSGEFGAWSRWGEVETARGYEVG